MYLQNQKVKSQSNEEEKRREREREREREGLRWREKLVTVVRVIGEWERRVFAPLYRVMRILVSFSVRESKLVCGAVTVRFMRALIIFKIVLNEIM